MSLDPASMPWVIAAGGGACLLMLILAFSGDKGEDMSRRLARVGLQGGGSRKIDTHGRPQRAVRDQSDSGIALVNQLVKLLPNPNKLRGRLARTGRNISLGEYFLINLLLALIFYLVFQMIGWAKISCVLMGCILGLGLPHFIVGTMGARRLKKFLNTFPEAIDTMCRGLRSGLPITESIAAVGREMPDPVGIEFHRIADGVHMGRSLEASMWEVAPRIDSPEYRFLIIAMAIQKETGGNLAETLGNLSDLIRRRRQLRLKIKAMSAEAKASAMIIGSLPFIMFTLLMLVNSEYMMTMFNELKGKIMLGSALFWMSMGWAVMTKMIHFEI
ncbi:MAG: type II secretion system F family protein [Bdellovibrionales bacterium]